jgi:hypothetical protein
MLNKNIVISIGILIILSVLFERFLSKTVLKENFEDNNTDVDPGPKCSQNGESCVDYSADFNSFKLNLTSGFFKLINADDSFMPYKGKLTIVFTKDDYRDSPFDTKDNILNSFRKWQYFKYDNKFYKIVIPEDDSAVLVSGNNNTEPEPEPNPGVCVGTDELDLTDKNCKTNYPDVSKKDACNADLWCEWSEGFQNKNDTTETFQNNTITLEFEFRSYMENETINFKDELVLSELSFYIGPYDNGNEFTKDRANQYATDLLSNLGEINNGVACGWHYNEETGGANGYFSEIINDKTWQNENPELYTSLSKFICPSYMPICTGQRRTGIVPGKCISLKDNCNNRVIDNMMGVETNPWDSTGIVDDEEIKYENVIKKNIANRDALTNTIDKLSYIFDEPSIETFENAEDNIETCNFHIENKCYDQYVEVDKNYYDTGAEIFNNVFPTTDQDIFKKTCYTITHWISKNIVYLLFYKLIVGGIGALLYWSINPHLDFQIRVFKSFIAFVFCEIYLLYNVYKHIIEPSITQRKSFTA